MPTTQHTQPNSTHPFQQALVFIVWAIIAGVLNEVGFAPILATMGDTAELLLLPAAVHALLTADRRRNCHCRTQVHAPR